MFKEVSDPIYEFIRVYPDELEILDTFTFQRLRHIKQLGITHMVFPSAQHTRFEHSLGVMNLAESIYGSLGYKDRKLLKVVRLAALLHDVGHPPFSHTTEVLLGDKSHEVVGKELILSGELNEKLKKIGFSQEDIELLVRLAFKEPKNEEEKVLSHIITGELGADRMDYLRRDAYFCGTSYGFFDYGRILSHLRVINGKKCADKSAIRALESFFLGRFFMYTQVYFHKVVRILNIHLLELIKDYMEREFFSKEEFHHLTDAHLIGWALKEKNNPLVRRLFLREHFREVFSTDDLNEYVQVVEFLKEKLDESMLRFDKAEKNVMDEGFYISYDGALKELREVSQLIRSLKNIRIYRIYVEASLKNHAIQYLKKAS
ncbi:HD domain-containing protein [Thermocrinis sp.]|uniref:HD domain-containing protein n=1 Tax=Thermocrinis sp. TaxID=2024383 RepID=UPI002FDC8DBF